MRAVVEIVPFMVRGRDRVYRIAPDELALIMPATNDEGAGAALARLLESVPKVLVERKLGGVVLSPRRVVADSAGARATS